MQDLLEMLLREPLILIFLAVWLLGGLGRLGQKAARRAVEEQEKQRRRAQERRDARGTLVQPERPRPQAPPPPVVEPAPRQRPGPDDIAAEIRRMMGMEPEPAPPPPPPPEVTPPRPAERMVLTVETVDTDQPRRPPPFETVAEQVAMQQPRAARAPRAPAHRPGVRRRRRRALLDLGDPAAAIVAMEVLGPPRAMRDFFS